MAPLKVDCTSGLVIEILYYLNQVGVTSISLLNAHIATKRFILVPRWGFCINKSANPTVEHLQPSPKKRRQRATKALGGWRGDGSAKI